MLNDNILFTRSFLHRTRPSLLPAPSEELITLGVEDAFPWVLGSKGLAFILINDVVNGAADFCKVGRLVNKSLCL